MSGLIKIEDYEVTVSENKSSDIALSSFGGYLGFVGEMSEQFGGTAGKTIGLVFAVSGGVITGVFDKELNPQKEYDNLIGTALIGYELGILGATAGRIIGNAVGGFIGGSVAGPVGAVVGAVLGAVVGGLWGDDIYDNGEKIVNALYHNLNENFEYQDSTIYGKVTQEEFILESVTNDPNFCKDIFPQYLNYRQIVDIKSGSTLAESVRYDNTTNEITISNSTSDNQNFYLNETLKNNDIDKATINDIVYIKQDLTNQTSLQIRNLLTDINSVNILLSNVLIKIDEKLDLGEKGIYTVKSGDTFSQIANNNGFTTKELLEKNTWLIDENRITFNTPSEILVNQTANLNNNNQNHTLIGTNSDDRLIDHNGGNDIFEAGTGTNYIDGGIGSDTISYKNITNSNKEGITLNLSLATAQAINSTTTDTLVNIENVIGSRYADNIIGKDNSTTTITLDGGDGDDILKVGLNSVNKLFGGAGDDTLVSTLIGFKNESAGIDYSKGSSYLNGGEGFDTYVVKDYVTIEDDDGRGEIQTKYGKLQELSIKELTDGTILLYKNNPMYLDIESTYNPLAGYTSGAFNTALGNFGTTTTQDMLLTNYELIFKLQKDGNDLILNDLTSNPTVIRIKNYTANSLNLNITQDMLDNLPNLNENQTPSPTNPTLIGTNESETLIGSEVNNTFISNAGNDTLKDISGGNDIYKFKKGDGADIIYDIKGNDTIIFDNTVKKEDITFSQSDDLKS
ncbi:MAG: LysM peptidoglycan-binding domain-containing protein [Arcobacter sp.]|uniref:LysM peptidoglycan-binding domain-containing protein n=1 Tax=Arcobacter sp. TaxID=1872629 RepID=UPI00258A942E|nr:LysM peptidoglycan-binding domain-containing protein [Arcobacter sp.]MDD3009480.1 LysM peptidoglycan-binding domain-containing protein [Arcobacter sp.]